MWIVIWDSLSTFKTKTLLKSTVNDKEKNEFRQKRLYQKAWRKIQFNLFLYRGQYDFDDYFKSVTDRFTSVWYAISFLSSSLTLFKWRTNSTSFSFLGHPIISAQFFILFNCFYDEIVHQTLHDSSEVQIKYKTRNYRR